VTVADVSCRLGSRYPAMRVVARSWWEELLEADSSGWVWWELLDGFRHCAKVRDLKGIHVEVQLSVGANSPSPVASQRFHVTNQGFQGLRFQSG